MSGVNYVIYGCPSSRTTPEVSMYRSLTLEKKNIPVITQDRVTAKNLKGKLKTELCIQLTPGNSNLQGAKENSSTKRMFELSETPVKANSYKNELTKSLTK